MATEGLRSSWSVIEGVVSNAIGYNSNSMPKPLQPSPFNFRYHNSLSSWLVLTLQNPSSVTDP
jgi:hypothetical protein